MTDRKTVERIVRETYGARLANDVEGTVKPFHANGTFAVSGAPGLGPSALVAKGAAEIRAGLETLIGAFEFLELEFLNLLVDGNEAAARVRVKMRVSATGEIIETDLGHFWTIEDGKVASVVEFRDTALVNHLMEKAKAA